MQKAPYRYLIQFSPTSLLVCDRCIVLMIRLASMYMKPIVVPMTVPAMKTPLLVLYQTAMMEGSKLTRMNIEALSRMPKTKARGMVGQQTRSWIMWPVSWFQMLRTYSVHKTTFAITIILLMATRSKQCFRLKQVKQKSITNAPAHEHPAMQLVSRSSNSSVTPSFTATAAARSFLSQLLS